LRLEALESRVTPQASLTFQFTPAAAVAGQPLSPAVQVLFSDDFGEGMPFPIDGDVVTLQVASGPGGVDSSSTVTAITGVNARGKPQPGVAVFSNLVLDAAGSYTFVATAADPELGSATSAPSSAVLVDPAAASRFVVAASASAVGQGEPL